MCTIVGSRIDFWCIQCHVFDIRRYNYEMEEKGTNEYRKQKCMYVVCGSTFFLVLFIQYTDYINS